MIFFIRIIPGVGIACSLFLLLICVNQLVIYKRTRYQRSLMIAFFSFFASLFSLEQFIVQSRLFDPVFTNYYIMISTAALCLSFAFYFRALSFFIAIPKWFYRIAVFILFALGLVASVGVPSRALFGVDLYFDSSSLVTTSNYFINSYSTRVGAPLRLVSWVTTSSGVVAALGSFVLLPRVLKSSKDVFFILGLTLSICAVGIESIPLSFTFRYFVPLVFMSNLFEAFRMNNLANEEYHIELNENEIKEEYREEIEVSKEKYQNSNLSEERVEQLANEVTRLLKEEQIFKHPNLYSAELAKKIGIPTYQLSQVINIGLNTSFFELISFYRIEYVKTLLESQDPDKKIIDLAYEAGFNSKSAFNTAFKKQTGLTPSNYKKMASH